MVKCYAWTLCSSGMQYWMSLNKRNGISSASKPKQEPSAVPPLDTKCVANHAAKWIEITLRKHLHVLEGK